MKIIPYLHLVYNVSFLIVGWIFGDWRNWQKYYPTILFFIVGDLIQNFITRTEPLWKYHGATPLNHITISLLIMVIAYPATILIFLKYALKSWKHFAMNYGLWVFLYSMIEWINLRLGLISHHHGWTLGWSIFINAIMFLSFRIHHDSPIMAWLMYLLAFIFIVIQFDIPVFM